jgi:hypothetical protein
MHSLSISLLQEKIAMTIRSRTIFNIFTLLTLLASLLGSALTFTPALAATTQIDINGPAGSQQFGSIVVTLPNGNFVVTDPFYDAPGPITDVGAVYLYNGATHALISMLTGSNAGDVIGLNRRVNNGVVVLTNGNFVVLSPSWDGGKGAVTWGSQTSGVSGVVSSANSLVGSTVNDSVGNEITVLTNGNYVVASPSWDGVKGAATWGDGSSGITGAVSSANSLVGSTANDFVGSRIIALTNGNYVVQSPNWDGYKGAATWGNGSSGITGAVSSANSLVGSTAGDNVSTGITALTNGNYVVQSANWDTGKGAATWGNGSSGTAGTVSLANSLVGSTAGDYVGMRITALTNGNYVVQSANWDGGKGAATWGNGSSGITGAVSSANSLVGSTAGDYVGSQITALTNGNYVAAASTWDGGKGAATWGNGSSGITGAVSSANSLVGSTGSDAVGLEAVTALTNGNYVVISPYWDGSKGAATWGNGSSGITGTISSANSLVGSTAGDYVSDGNITALPNGNYVVASRVWDGGKGAATWGNGSSGITGAVSSSNSLVGSTAGDYVSNSGITALSNGNYVVASPSWDGAKGAATWGDGSSGITGAVSSTNSLVGSTANDIVGRTNRCRRGSTCIPSIMALTNGNYIVTSFAWDGTATDSGAVTLGFGPSTTGVITSDNSVLGTAVFGGSSFFPAYDYVNDQMIVGRPADNIVTIFKISNPSPPVPIFADVPFNNWANTWVEILYNAGITAGCATDPHMLYCPDAPVTRAQMAIFILRSEHGGNYTPPPATGTVFADVPLGSFADAWIEQLAAEGITAGCGGGNYCPDDSITRAEMSIFLLRGEHGSAYTPPAATGAVFGDVTLGSFADAWIEQLFNEGITAGCGGGDYCPGNPVTRAEMAVFLVETFNLP